MLKIEKMAARKMFGEELEHFIDNILGETTDLSTLDLIFAHIKRHPLSFAKNSNDTMLRIRKVEEMMARKKFGNEVGHFLETMSYETIDSSTLQLLFKHIEQFSQVCNGYSIMKQKLGNMIYIQELMKGTGRNTSSLDIIENDVTGNDLINIDSDDDFCVLTTRNMGNKISGLIPCLY